MVPSLRAVGAGLPLDARGDPQVCGCRQGWWVGGVMLRVGTLPQGRVGVSGYPTEKGG